MKIDYADSAPRYFDEQGNELHADDLVLYRGRVMRVLLTDAETLGTDATSVSWLKAGRACEGEYGIYPFEECDDPLLVCKAGEYKQYDPATGEWN